MKTNSRKDKGYRVIKLTTGDKIIAKIIGSNENKLMIDRPMIIKGMVMGDMLGGVQKEFVMLNKWAEYSSDERISLYKKFVMIIYKPDDALFDMYDKAKKLEDSYDEYTDSKDVAFSSDDLDADIDAMIEEHGLDGVDEEHIRTIMDGVLENIINKLNDPAEEWSEEDIDKSREDYGNDLEDWSPYTSDYFDES